MLAYILEIIERGNKGTTNRGRFKGLQIGARGIANRGSLRYFKSGQGFQIEAKRFQIGLEITNRGNGDYKSGQGLQIGAEQVFLRYIKEINRLIIKGISNIFLNNSY